MKDFKLKVEWVDPQSLTPYVNNAKIHDDDQIDKLAGSIAEFGFDQPIVVDKDRVIIKGHGRREAALRLNMSIVPIIIAEHLDESQVKAARIADNKVSSLKYDPERLRFDIGSLDRVNFNLNLTGLEFDEIKEMLAFGDVTETPLPSLSNSPKSMLQQMAFQITESQKVVIDKAIKVAKSLGDFTNSDNANSNANALALICDFFLGQNQESEK